MLSLSDTNGRFLQSWLRLQKLMASGQIHQQNTVYVDATYGTAAGQRNNPAKPFRTVQQGVNAAQSGDVVLIAPGTYVENVTMPALSRLALIGASELFTFVQGVGGVTSPVISINPGVNVIGSWTISGLTLINGSPLDATPALDVDVSGTTTSFQAPGLWVQDVAFLKSNPAPGISVRLRSVNLANLLDIAPLDSIVVRQCSQVNITSNVGLSAIDADYQLAGTEPVGGQGTLSIKNTRASSMILTNLQRGRFEGVQLGATSGVFMDDVGSRRGEIDAQDCDFNSLAVSAVLSTVPNATILDAKGCRAGSLSCVKLGGGPAIVEASFRMGDLRSSIGPIVADGVALDLRGSEFDEAQLSAPNAGTIDRSFIQLSIPAADPGWAAGNWTGTYSPVPLPNMGPDTYRVFLTTSLAQGAVPGDTAQFVNVAYPNFIIQGINYGPGPVPTATGVNVLIARNNP